MRILANINKVSKSVGRSPKKSLRKTNQELGINIGSLRAILKKYLNLYPYKIQIKQVITDEEMKKWLQMARCFENQLQENEKFLDEVWFSDKARFFLKWLNKP